MPRPLRIAQIAPLVFPVPPGFYGGTERVISYLTEALVAAGQEVTLFACRGSTTSARLVETCPFPLAEQPGSWPRMATHHATVRRRLAEFDILHFHEDCLHVAAFMDVSRRTLTTIHAPLGCPDISSAYEAVPEMPLISISESQRRPNPGWNWAATIHHGVPADIYTAGGGEGGYLAFIGRLGPHKQPHAAISIALRSGNRIKLAGPTHPVDVPYANQSLAPHVLDPMVEFVGELDDAGKNPFLGQAKALLFPIAWEEPFGLVMIEAMATGTPVIAYRRGAVPEVVEDGVTGFIVDTEDEAVAAVGRLGELDRAIIRRRFDERFSARRMAADHIELYWRQLETAGLDCRQ